MLFSNIIAELTGSVGNGLANQSSDIKKVKDGLSNLGLFKDNEIEEQDFITRDLDEGIKSFQRDKNLKVDGRLFPKGETERELFGNSVVEIQPKKPKQKPETNPLLNLVEQIIKPKSVAQSDVIADLKAQQSLTSEDVPTPSRKPLFEISKIKEGLEKNKPINIGVARRSAMLDNSDVKFSIEQNKKAITDKPAHAFHFFNQVKDHQNIIDIEAENAGIDPDLVKAVIYLETTHGWYDKGFDKTGVNKTIRPMNVHYKYWKDLGYSHKDLLDPVDNIKAGIKILSGISKRVDGGSIKDIGTLYNNLSARKVSDYGARLEKIYKEKLWEK